MLKNCIYVFLISMVPVIELRGAIPVGVGLGLPVWLAFLISIVGNIIPVPFILIFVRKILEWMKGVKYLDKIALWLEKKADKASTSVMKYATVGLFVFVAIPLPGTGAWTGSLVASVFKMKFGHSLISVICGVVCAGIIVSLICSGVLGVLSFLL